jgi:hypothetical protein
MAAQPAFTAGQRVRCTCHYPARGEHLAATATWEGTIVRYRPTGIGRWSIELKDVVVTDGTAAGTWTRQQDDMVLDPDIGEWEVAS